MHHNRPALGAAVFTSLILCSLILSSWLIPPAAPAQAGSDARSANLQTEPPKSILRIYYADPDQLTAIAGRLDIWENHPEKGYAVAALSPEEIERLEQLGLRLEVDTEKTTQTAPQAVLDPRFYYYDNYVNNPNGLYLVDFLQETELTHPQLTELLDLGDAWQASHGGHARDIWALRITNEDPAYGAISTKPAFVLFAGIHAREVATPELAIRYVRYLLEGYGGAGGYGLDPDSTWLIDNHVIYVVLMQNPDGHVPNEQNTSAYRRKNMDSDDGCTQPASWGVDLNRNHSFFWGDDNSGSSPYPCDETYRGPSQASEPETQAFQNFFASVMLDQNGPNGDFSMPPAAPDDTTGVFLSLHSYSDLVIWPWSLDPPPANEAQLRAIGRKMGYLTGLTPSGGIGYPVNGATDDWTYGKFGIPSFTIEIGPSGGTCGGFFPAYDCVDGNGVRSFWDDIRPSLLYLHKIARTPYLTVYGPDTAQAEATPGVVQAGDQVTLTATIADHRYGSDPLAQISGAEYFIDSPGTDGSGTPMLPLDGSWGGLSEAVTAEIDTSSLTQGRHVLLIHGKSAANRWGPSTAVFLYVMQPGVAPVIEGHVRQEGTNYPLHATVRAGIFQTNTDPATGFYSLPVVSGIYNMQAAAAGHATATVSGVVSSDYETTQQDFTLSPMCSAFSDNVESGNLGWTANLPWAITTETANSPTHSWTDSPGGEYADNINLSLTSPMLDLSTFSNVTLTFWHQYATEAGFDYGYVEYSTNGGSTWTPVQAYDGLQSSWSQVTAALPQLDGEPDARLRFRLSTDEAVSGDGWRIDDIEVLGTGPACDVIAPPIAGFNFSTPVVAGQPVQFTNQTVGSEPITYTWDFGDQSGVSTLRNPIYTYDQTGSYTATVTAVNAYGSDTFSHSLQVEPCVEINAINLTQITPDPIVSGDLVELSLELSPDNAYKPYSYSLDFGDGTPPLNGDQRDDPLLRAHVFAAAGAYNVTAQVSNCAMPNPLSTHITLTIQERHGMTLLPTVSSLSGDPGSVVTHTLQLSNTGEASDTFTLSSSTPAWATTIMPITLTLPAGGAAPISVLVVVPEDAIGADADSLTLGVDSSFSDAPPAFASIITSAASIYRMGLDAPITERLGHPGDVVTYPITIHNTGNSGDTYDISASGTTWTVGATPNPVTIPAGNSLTVEIWIAIPGSASGSLEPAQITVRSRGDPAQSASTLLTTSADWRVFLAELAR